MSAEEKKNLNLFYCYAREDKVFRDALDNHLSNMKRQNHIVSWSDREISPGSEWEKEIDTHLKTAHVILLLVSADFMASNYCYGVEMKHALDRHKAGTARVIPIILRPSDWENAPFSNLQLLPTDAKPVSKWQDRDDAFWDITQGIRKAVEELRILLKTPQEWLDEGNIFYHLNNYEEALAAYDQAIHLGPNYALAHYHKGLALLNLKEDKEALAAYDQAVRLDPDLALHLDPNYALAYYHKGLVLHNLNNYEEALAAYNQAIRLNPSNALVYHSKGLALHNLGRYEEAIAAYDQAIRLDPNNADTYYSKGLALLNLKGDKEALAAYDQAIHLNPNVADVYHNKSLALERLKRLQRGKRLL